MSKTKRKLSISILCILLILVTTVGSTYAWFTDSVLNTGNKIQAGTLDVTLSQYKVSDTTTNPITKAWVDIGDSIEPAFNSGTSDLAYWEPGYSQYGIFKISNTGNLAFEYKLNIVANETSSLNDVIDVYAAIVDQTTAEAALGLYDNFKDGTSNLTKLGTLTEVMADKDGVAYGALLIEGSTVSKPNYEKVKDAYAIVVLHMQEEAGNDYQGLSASFDIELEAKQYTYEEDGFGNNEYDENALYYEFGPQYKYEINQLAKYMNMDGDELEDLLLAWTNDTSNRNKTYAELINDINTKDEALCTTAIYILSFEHLVVSDSTISNIACTEIAKCILSSDVVFKNIKILFQFTANDSVTDEIYVSSIRQILSKWNQELLYAMGLNGEGEAKVLDIYDTFRYSIDHAKEEAPVGNTYELTANTIYKVMNIANPNINVSLDDIKASMNRMIAKSVNNTIIDSQLISQFSSKTEEEQKQLAYDYTTYCYMCAFGLMSGDPAYNALSNHFTEKEFTSMDAINYVLNSDYIFKALAYITESVEAGVAADMFVSSFSNLYNGKMISDIYGEYTSDYNEMYKAIGEIFSY